MHLLTPKEAAEMLGRSTRTLEKWRRTDPARLPYIADRSAGGRLTIRYELETIHAYVDARRIGGTIGAVSVTGTPAAHATDGQQGGEVQRHT